MTKEVTIRIAKPKEQSNIEIPDELRSPGGCIGCSPNDKDNDCGFCKSLMDDNAETTKIVPQNEAVTVLPACSEVSHTPPKKYTDDQLLLLRHVIAKGCTEPEFRLMMYMASVYELDPLLKEIWAIKRNDKDPAVIMVGRDGMLSIAHRSGHFDGMQSGVKYEKDKDGKDHPTTAWCTIWRNDMTHPFETEVRFEEYVQPIPKSGYLGLWQTKPSVMILKCAESVCLRKAFRVSGVYSPEEIS